MPQTPENAVAFDRHLAFSRTLGLVTREEMQSLQQKTIAIVGLGGVGGSQLLTLTRLGIGGFHLADFDTFGIENFNRHAGACMPTVGRKKLDVMEKAARDINPDLRIRRFPQGVTPENVPEFLTRVGGYVDRKIWLRNRNAVQKVKIKSPGACWKKREAPSSLAAPKFGVKLQQERFFPIRCMP